MWAMPAATVQKITGAMAIFTSLMKASPSGLSDAPKCGQSQPTSAPSAVATTTCTQSCRKTRKKPIRCPTPSTPGVRTPLRLGYHAPRLAR